MFALGEVGLTFSVFGKVLTGKCRTSNLPFVEHQLRVGDVVVRVLESSASPAFETCLPLNQGALERWVDLTFV